MEMGKVFPCEVPIVNSENRNLTDRNGNGKKNPSHGNHGTVEIGNCVQLISQPRRQKIRLDKKHTPIVQKTLRKRISINIKTP